MHDLVIVGIPLLAILAGILFNRHDVSRLEGRFDRLEVRIDARFNAMDVRFDNLHRDMHEFYRILGEHGARIAGIEKKIS